MINSKKKEWRKTLVSRKMDEKKRETTEFIAIRNDSDLDWRNIFCQNDFFFNTAKQASIENGSIYIKFRATHELSLIRCYQKPSETVLEEKETDEKKNKF